jgi:hypothetical protein
MFEIQDISSRLLLVSDGLLVCEEFEYLLLFIIYFFYILHGQNFSILFSYVCAYQRMFKIFVYSCPVIMFCTVTHVYSV